MSITKADSTVLMNSEGFASALTSEIWLGLIKDTFYQALAIWMFTKLTLCSNYALSILDYLIIFSNYSFFICNALFVYSAFFRWISKFLTVFAVSFSIIIIVGCSFFILFFVFYSWSWVYSITFLLCSYWFFLLTNCCWFWS